VVVGALSSIFFMNKHPITAQEVPTSARATHVRRLFQARWLWIEAFAFDTASSLSEDYEGGYWNYFALSNEGFYMAPSCGEQFSVACSNGFEGRLSADALGIAACLYSYSFLSFSPDADFAQCCANHFHRLREFAVQHSESAGILAAID
jgi:hypothetical protein